jgi:protein gp37
MTTITSQGTRGRLDELNKVPSKFKGLSCEPIFTELDLDLSGVDWLIAGGGSDVIAQPFHVEWSLKLRDQCVNSGTAFFLKQLGKNPYLNGERIEGMGPHGGDWSLWPAPDWKVREIPAGFRQLNSIPLAAREASAK